MNETTNMEAIAVQGVTLREDLAVITLQGVPNTPGVAARIFAEVAANHIMVDDIVQSVYDGGSVANLSFSTNVTDAREVKNVCDKIAAKLGIARVNVDEGVSKVSAVGVGMRTHTGIAATMFEALASATVNIENISTSEIVISCLVRREDGQRALRAIHDAFKLHEKNG